MSIDTQNLYRWLYKTKFVSNIYGYLAGPASVKMFSASLDQDFLKHMPIDAEVLEIGSGPGLQAIEMIIKRPDIHLVASDFSERFVQLGQRNLSKAISQSRVNVNNGTEPLLAFVQANAMDLDVFPESSFDGVYSMTAIKHFPDPVRGIKECLGILRPGGCLFISEFYKEASWDDMCNLLKIINLPGIIKPLVGRIIYSGLKKDSPSLSDVRKWLIAANIKESKFKIETLDGYPVWLATLIK